MIFSQLQNAVFYTPPEGPEITGLRLQCHIGELVDDFIKALFEEGKNLALVAPILIGSHHVIVRVLVQEGNHVPDNFRPLLQVGVNQADIISVCVLQPGI